MLYLWVADTAGPAAFRLTSNCRAHALIMMERGRTCVNDAETFSINILQFVVNHVNTDWLYSRNKKKGCQLVCSFTFTIARPEAFIIEPTGIDKHAINILLCDNINSR